MSAIFESKRLRPKPSPHTRPPSPLPLGRLFRRPAFFPPPRNEAGTAAFFDSPSESLFASDVRYRLLATNCQLCIFLFVKTFFLSLLPSW